MKMRLSYLGGLLAKGLWVISAIVSVFLSFSGLTYAADPEKGEQLYSMNCASCHGVTGEGVMFGAPNFDQGEGLFQADSALLNSVKNGKNAMPAYQGILSDMEILDVIAYLHTLY